MISFPCNHSFHSGTDIISAANLPGVNSIVDNMTQQYRTINVSQTMTQLTFVGTALQLAYAGSRGFSCCTKILGILSSFQGIVKETQYSCGAFVDGSLRALRYHSAAYKVVNQNTQAALQIISQCAAVAQEMENLSEELEKKAEKLKNESHDALLLTLEDSFLSGERKKEVIRKMQEQEIQNAKLSETLESLSNSIEEERKREEKARTEKNELQDSIQTRATWSPLVSILTFGIVNLNANKTNLEKQAQQAREDELESAKHRRNFEDQQRKGQSERVQSIEKLQNASLENNDLEVAISSLEISNSTLGAIKTTFENTRIFWKTVKNHCNKLKDNSTMSIYAQNNLHDLMIDEIKLSGFNWLTLGKITFDASIDIQTASENVDQAMSNLPNTEEAMALIKKESPKIINQIKLLWPCIGSS